MLDSNAPRLAPPPAALAKAGVAAAPAALAEPDIAAAPEGGEPVVAPNKAAPGTWAWFLEQVEEARQEADDIVHPNLAYPNWKRLLYHRKRWSAMAGAGESARSPATTGLFALGLPAPILILMAFPEIPWFVPLGAAAVMSVLLFAYQFVGQMFKEVFIPLYVTERLDWVEPHLPTAILLGHVPRAAVADRPELWHSHSGVPAFRDPEAYIWVEMFEDSPVSELLTMKAVLDCIEDRHRMEDVIDIERRTQNRLIQSTGYLQAEVDKPPKAPVNPLKEYASHLTGIAFAASGLLALALG